MPRWVRCVLVVVGLAACLGCGGQGGKETHKDLDRPRPAPAEKPA